MKSRLPILTLAILAALTTVTGCQGVARYLAYVFAPAIPAKEVPAEYPGLENHSIAIVVYADADTQFQYPLARWELSMVIAAQMQKNIKGIRVFDPRNVIRRQDEDLNWDTQDKTAMGKAFGVDYVLYVAMSRFTTHEPGSEYLYRGDIIADVSLYQTSLPERKARVWYANDMHASYPPEARTADNDLAIRGPTEGKFAEMLVKKFYTYKVENEE